MTWNGAGAWNRLFNWTNDRNAAIDITASRMDSEFNDITNNGLGNALTRDGQGIATANLPMGGFRHTGVGNGVAVTDYAAVGQLQGGTVAWAVATGTADAIAANYVPAIAALTDGLQLGFRATAANATTTPSFSPNGLTPHSITKRGGAALVAGDIAGNLAEVMLLYNLANTCWELVNPGVLPVALPAEMRTASAANRIATPANMNDHDGVAKVLVFCNLSGVIQGISTNVASVVRNSAGNYTVSFTRGFATANYIAIAGLEVAGGTANGISTIPAGRAAGSLIINTFNTTNGIAADAAFSLVCFGRQ